MLGKAPLFIYFSAGPNLLLNLYPILLGLEQDQRPDAWTTQATLDATLALDSLSRMGGNAQHQEREGSAKGPGRPKGGGGGRSNQSPQRTKSTTLARSETTSAPPVKASWYVIIYPRNRHILHAPLVLIV